MREVCERPTMLYASPHNDGALEVIQLLQTRIEGLEVDNTPPYGSTVEAHAAPPPLLTRMS